MSAITQATVESRRQVFAAHPADFAPAVPCALCGATARMPGRPWPEAVATCQRCSLMFAHPQPTDAQLDAIYGSDYYGPFGYDVEKQDLYRRMKQAWFSRILAIGERHAARGRLLDFGSGLGDLLAVARSRGWHVLGIEPNPFAVTQAEGVLPGATFHGGLAQLAGDCEPFDLVTCCDVLEHVRDPMEELRQMRRVLKPGGCLLITTIDASGWQARLSGRRWIHYLPEHLWYFNRDTLTRFVTAAGLQFVHWEVPRKIFNLRYILGIFEHHSRNHAWRSVWNGLLKTLPGVAQAALLPGLPEGQLLVARKPFESEAGQASKCP